MEEIAARAQFRGDADDRPDLRHVRGMPHRRRETADRSTARRPSWCLRATRCASRSPPSAAASSSTRAPRRSPSDPRGRTVFQKLADEEKEHLGTLEKRYRELLAQDPQLESRPTFLFFKGAANGIFAEGAEKLRAGRGRSAGAAHRHPLRARFAQVLQEVRRALRRLRRQADLPRVCRRRARAPRPADRANTARCASAWARDRAGKRRRAGDSVAVDRSPHPYDRVRRPLHAAPSWSRAPPRPASRCSASPITTPSPAARPRRGACAARRHRVRARHRNHRGRRRRRRARARILHRSRFAGAARPFSRSSAQRRSIACGEMVERLADARHRARRRRDSSARRSTIDSKAAGRPWIARALVAAGARRRHAARRSTAGCRAGGRHSCRASAPRPRKCSPQIHEAGGIASLAHPGLLEHDEWIRRLRRRRPRRARGVPQRARRLRRTARYLDLAERLALPFPEDPTTTAIHRTASPAPGSVSLPPELFRGAESAAPARRATASGASTSS